MADKAALLDSTTRRLRDQHRPLSDKLRGRSHVRAMADAPAMTSPPTFTLGSGFSVADPTINDLTQSQIGATSRALLPTDARIRVSGGAYFDHAFGTAANPYYGVQGAGVGGTFGPGLKLGTYAMAHDGQLLEIIIRAVSGGVTKTRVWTTEGGVMKPHSLTARSDTWADNSYHSLLIDFGSSAKRPVFIELENALVAAFRYAPTDVITYSRVPAGPRLLVVGASYEVAGGPGGSQLFTGDTWLWRYGRGLGFEDIHACSAGGAGYTATSGGAVLKFLDRMTAEGVFTKTYDLILFAGQRNDGTGIGAATFTQAQVAADISATLTATKTAFPNTPILVQHPQQAARGDATANANDVIVAGLIDTVCVNLGIPAPQDAVSRIPLNADNTATYTAADGSHGNLRAQPVYADDALRYTCDTLGIQLA